ncbi:MAG: nitric oxide reductase activation protein NorD [Thiohalospira sp.]
MSINLEDYRECLDKAGGHVSETLEASYAEASRVMSPRGLANYLEGARALCELGRGTDLVESYLESMPAVAREVGEDVVPSIASAAMKLSSMVSGAVIALLMDSMPTAARRLGDAGLVEDYLELIHKLSARATRGLRPMLEHLDELFSKLTLGGLRRWAMWGAEAHARDFEAMKAYFALESADSQAVLQKERRGVLFVDNQRRLNMYLRALWGRDFFLRPTSGDVESREGFRPFIQQQVIHLPDAYDAYDDIPGTQLYRAAAAHAAAHIVYTTEQIDPEGLSSSQKIFVGLFEDARVEALALEEFPGLGAIWQAFHDKLVEVSCATDPVVSRMERAARAMLEPDYADDDPWVREAADAFREAFAERPRDPQMSRELGLRLFDRVTELGHAMPTISVLESVAIPYRDDNRYLFVSEESDWFESEYLPASQQQVRKTVSLMELVNELDCELAGDDAQEIWRYEGQFWLDQEACTINELEGKEPVSEPFHYPEWDYQVQLHRPDWVSVIERRQGKGDPEDIEQILTDYKPVASRIKHIIDALQPQGVIRQRHQEDGDQIDINAAVDAMVDLRMGHSPDPRVNVRLIRKTRDLAVVVLLDMSESTNETLAGSDRTVLDLTREAASLLSWAIDGIGDPFAVHGFASDGRHDVQYYRYKDFGEGFNDKVKSRLAGMQGGLSTRMGGALRHAANHLKQQPQQKKLVLMVTDGEPSDIDIRDPQYLRQDTKKAVEELGSEGIMTYCLTLDPEADDYVSRIFGPNRYTIIDHVQKLPEKLPALFASLTS